MPKVKTIEAPTIAPNETPWQEEFTSPDEICDQQHRELASPDVAP